MSFDISSSELQRQDNSFFALDLVTHSYQFTPVMELEGVDSAQSSPQPRILLFSADLPTLGAAIKKKSTDLFYGSKLYESFEVDHQTENSQSLEVQEFEEEDLRKNRLYQSISQFPPSSSALSRRDSITYFSEQLNELKRNVDKLMRIIGERNPEQLREKDANCSENHNHSKSSIEIKSLDAKSTQSQQLKDQSILLQRSINCFQSPKQKLSLSIHNISPILHREIQRSQPSNTSETSTRSLMRKKMRPVATFSAFSA